MKTLNKLLTAVVIASVAGCGGGGGASDASAVPNTPTVTNPLTGNAAPGTQTKLIRGVAYNGATVIAYKVQADGASGAALSAASTANAFGEFSLDLSEAQTILFNR
jgi:hypothetical protein